MLPAVALETQRTLPEYSNNSGEQQQNHRLGHQLHNSLNICYRAVHMRHCIKQPPHSSFTLRVDSTFCAWATATGMMPGKSGIAGPCGPMGRALCACS